jgi:tetratricopeptide (TPR) repeat protein
MSIQVRKATLLFLLFFISTAPWLAAQDKQQMQAEVDSLNALFNQTYTVDLVKAEQLATKALDLSVQSGYKFGEAGARSNFCAYYLKKDDFTKAIESGLAAIKIYDTEEKLKNTFEYGNTYIRLAKSFYMVNDDNRTKAYCRQAIVIAERIHDQHLLALGYEHLGNIYSIALQVDSALYYYNRAKKDFIRTNYTSGLANVATNTGAMYSDKGDHQDAINYFREALAVYQNNNLNAALTTGHYNMGFTYHLLKSYEKALQHTDSAEYYAKEFKRANSLLKAYMLKAQIYGGMGNVDSSASYYEKTIALKDSIQNDTYKKELATLQTQSDVYKKETENKLLTKDKRIAVLYRNLAVAGIVGLVITLGFLLLNQRLRIQRRVKNRLEEEVALRTQEIFRQKETIFHTNLSLKLALNGAKFDSQFAVNALNTVQHLVLQQKPVEAQNHLAKLSLLMQYVLEKSPLDRVPLVEELQMVESYIQLEQLRLHQRFNYNITMHAGEHTTIPALLLHPYVEDAVINSIEPASGDHLQLNLQLIASGDVLTIIIEDNGIKRGKGKQVKQHMQGFKVGQERLDLLTQLTHKSHLVVVDDLPLATGSSGGTKVLLEIPLESQPTAAKLKLQDEEEV